MKSMSKHKKVIIVCSIIIAFLFVVRIGFDVLFNSSTEIIFAVMIGVCIIVIYSSICGIKKHKTDTSKVERVTIQSIKEKVVAAEPRNAIVLQKTIQLHLH